LQNAFSLKNSNLDLESIINNLLMYTTLFKSINTKTEGIVEESISIHFID